MNVISQRYIKTLKVAEREREREIEEKMCVTDEKQTNQKQLDGKKGKGKKIVRRLYGKI